MFVVLCVIFTLYAIDVIDINPKLIPLLLIVSIYLLSCKNWNIFSKENREAFSEDEKGTLVIPGNLQVKGTLFVEDNVEMKKRVQIDGETKCQNIDTGNIVSNDITGKKITASSLNCEGKLNASNIKTIRVNLNTVHKDIDSGWTDLSPHVGGRFNGIIIVKSVHNDYASGVFGVSENSAWDPGNVFTISKDNDYYGIAGFWASNIQLGWKGGGGASSHLHVRRVTDSAGITETTPNSAKPYDITIIGLP